MVCLRLTLLDRLVTDDSDADSPRMERRVPHLEQMRRKGDDPADATRSVTGGVDTHLDVNVAAALNRLGGLLGVAKFPTPQRDTVASPGS